MASLSVSVCLSVRLCLSVCLSVSLSLSLSLENLRLEILMHVFQILFLLKKTLGILNKSIVFYQRPLSLYIAS